jgi:pilus assembly protein CpaB
LASDRDIALPDERGSTGLALDEDLAEGIPLVGFDDDGGSGEAVFVGSTEASAGADRVGVRQALSEHSRRAAMAIRSAALALFDWLRWRFAGTHLRIRRLRAAIVPAVAMLAAVGIGLAVRHWLPARQLERIIAGPLAPPSVPSVLVASQPIGRGRILQRGDMQWQPWPSAAIKQSYFRRGTHHLSDLQGYVVRTPIAAGQPVTAGDVAAPAGRGFMAAMLNPGMRAISVAIGPGTAAGGLIMPGDEVDIVLSMPVPAFDAAGNVSSSERASAETLLRGIRVLAIDQEADGHDGRAIVGRVATLEVTPKQAEIVTLADELAVRGAMLVLALRSIRSESAEADGAIGASHMLDTDVSKLLPDRPVSPPQSAPLTIVRRGTRSQP